jgi:pimeloyl-ACP methyl ester carboxylesterase
MFSDRYRCVVFDHRSFGLTQDPEKLGQDGFVADLKALLDHLQIDRAALVAQSMGGRTCLGFALAYPERVSSLVLADTTAGVSEPRLLQALERLGPVPTDLLQRVVSPGFRRDEPQLAFLYRQIEALNHIGKAPTALHVRGPIEAELAQLSVPTLLIVGSEDVIAPPAIVQLFSEMLPGSRVEIIPRAGHSAYFERAPEFNKAVARFLYETGSGGRRNAQTN